MFKFKPLAIALATAAASSAAFAGNVAIEATGYGVDQKLLFRVSLDTVLPHRLLF